MQSLSTKLYRNLSLHIYSKCKNIFTFVELLTYSMLKLSRHIVRMAIVVMLFQFVCPAFISIVVQQIPSSRETCFSVQHTSIVAPMLLKEKDEQESSEFVVETNCAPLLDLLSHSSNLTATHQDKYSESREEHPLAQPPLFTMFCSFLI